MILGEGEERPKLEALVRELGLEEDVALPGFVGNPYKYIARAGVFVLSSAWEGLPTTLVEALALGTPVVSTNCKSGPEEILEEGRWGRLVPVGNIEELAKAIGESLSMPRLLNGGALDRFRVDIVVDRYLEVMSI
jgi:glycosyltransferase involved in cell wall biosynthesis